MKVAVDEIIGVEGAVAASKLASPSLRGSHVTVTAQPSEGTAMGEINVIGMRVEEATERVDKYLDEAALANQTRVRIIHGHGTGALRKGLGEFLKSHPLVQRTSFETEERGGKAITVVDLRP
jgi:DNA mismatch repair protein MutS2